MEYVLILIVAVPLVWVLADLFDGIVEAYRRDKK